MVSLHNFGTDKSYQVNLISNEYLVDLCWCFSDKYEKAYWIELALESELSGQDVDSIRYDFWKLVDVKAYTKVGIFAPKLKDWQKVLDELSALVAHHGIRIPEEKYLIISYLSYIMAKQKQKNKESKSLATKSII